MFIREREKKEGREEITANIYIRERKKLSNNILVIRFKKVK